MLVFTKDVKEAILKQIELHTNPKSKTQARSLIVDSYCLTYAILKAVY